MLRLLLDDEDEMLCVLVLRLLVLDEDRLVADVDVLLDDISSIATTMIGWLYHGTRPVVVVNLRTLGIAAAPSTV